MATAQRARQSIRHGQHRGPTAALAPGFVQANLAILPADWAFEFLQFCHKNPKPCPLLAVSEPGSPNLPAWGEDLDIRTDLPAYRVFQDGVAVDEVSDLNALWREDFVSFALGCSFSFEEALIEAGLEVRHHKLNRNVPMYRTSIDTSPAGRFEGKMVVSMRPYRPADAIRAVQVTSRFPNVHGAPIHLGMPEAIGIDSVTSADFGDDPIIHDGEMPVFWACGVTPQVIIEKAKPPVCITHKPGHMLITDRSNASLAVI